jgi:RNA polymerase sigma-70 factor (ECF subfamily)
MTPEAGDQMTRSDVLGGRKSWAGRDGVGVADQERDAVLLAVAGAKRGEKDAVHFLYVRFSDNVYGYVRSIVQDEHEAEDVTQAVFAKVMHSIGSYEERSVPFLAWVIRIARNAAYDHVRGRRSVPVEEVRAVNHRDELGDSERATDLRKALATLPDDQRRVLVMRHVVGMSPAEIAADLGRSEGSVHGLHHRGRRALRAALVERGAAPVTTAQARRVI